MALGWRWDGEKQAFAWASTASCPRGAPLEETRHISETILKTMKHWVHTLRIMILVVIRVRGRQLLHHI
jgi:hypothetical protein